MSVVHISRILIWLPTTRGKTTQPVIKTNNYMHLDA